MLLSIPPEKQTEAVLSILAIGAGILKWFSDRGDKKATKEVEEDKKKEPEEEVEVVTKSDFDKLVEEVEKGRKTYEGHRNAFEDVLAMQAIVTILLQELVKDKTLLKKASEGVYVFLRHNDFPSRQMITAMFECNVKEVEEKEK